MLNVLAVLVVAFYIRVSTSKQAEDGYSLEAQFEECLKLAKRMYGENVKFEVYMDEGISGKSMDKRSALQRMLEDIAQGKVSAVITWKVSRLARKLSDSLQIVDHIIKSGANVISIKEGDYSTPDGRLKFNLLAAVAEYQREELAENVQLGMTKRASDGFWNGGRVLGYQSKDKELVIVPEEAATVQIMFRKITEENWGAKRLVNYLNSCGYRTKSGNPFRIDSVHRILRNPVYKGYVRFNQVINWSEKRRSGTNEDALVAPGHHEPIISEDVWNDAQDKLNARATGMPRQYSGTFPLTGIAKCPECGSFMTSMYGSKRKDGTKARYYVCGAYHNSGKSVCNPNLVRAEVLESNVWERLHKTMCSDQTLSELVNRINQQINRENLQPNAAPTESQQLAQKLRSLEGQKDRILQGFEAGIYTMAEASDKLKPLRESITQVEQELAAIDRTAFQMQRTNLRPVTVHDLRRQLQEFDDLRTSLNVVEFRTLLHTCIPKIEVKNKALSHVHFAFFLRPSEDSSDLNSDPEDPLHIPLYNVCFFPKKRHLFVIWFTVTVQTASIKKGAIPSG